MVYNFYQCVQPFLYLFLTCLLPILQLFPRNCTSSFNSPFSYKIPSIWGSSTTGSYGALFILGLKMGNSMFASLSTHFSHAASVAVTYLILLLLTGRYACIYSLNLLLFLWGTRVSKPAVDVEGIFHVSVSSLSSTIYVSSSIKVPLHLGEDLMVRTYIFSSVTTAPIALASTVATSNAAPALASAVGTPKFSISYGFSSHQIIGNLNLSLD